MSTAVDVLVWVAVALELSACLGLVLARSHYDRLHYASAAAVAPPVVLAVAVGLDQGVSTSLWNAIAVAGLLVLANALLTHGTARAARKREYASVAALPEERNA